MSRRRYIVIGDGAAGTTAAQYLRSSDPESSITILSDDPNAAYFRAALTNYLLGELREDQIFAVPPSFYYENQVNRVLARVASIDPANNQLWLAQGGRPLDYDGLVIGAGARANPPTFEGAWLPGIMTMRTLGDVRKVMDLIKLHGLRNAVVVGGGPLALEWAHGLNIRGVKVTMMIRERRFLPQSLDAVGSDLLLARLKQAGVDVRMGDEITAAFAGPNGRVAGAMTKSGARLQCELLAVAIGVVCNSEFLKGSPIALTPRGAVIVDRHLRTNVPNVYAAGDIVSLENEVLQLWEPARNQARVAALNLAGVSDETYDPGAHYMATRLYDLDFASIGQAATPVEGAEEFVDFPQRTGKISYRKAVVKDGRLIGALMFGQREEKVRQRGRLFKRLIDERSDVSFLKAELLDPTLDLASILKPRGLVKKQVSAGSAPATVASPGKMRGTQAISIGDLVPPASKGATGAMTAVPDVTKMKGTQALSVMPDLTRITPPAVADHSPQQQQAANLAMTMAAPPGAGKKAGTQAIAAIGATGTAPLLPTGQIFVEGPPGRFELPPGGAVIGSDPSCGVPVRDPQVSHMHAQITRVVDDAYVRDLGSGGGTWVNGNAVTIPHRLKNGDRIRVGSTDFVVKMIGGAVSERASAAPSQLPSALGLEASPHLEVRSGHSLGLSFALDTTKQQISIGSDPICEVRLDDPSIMRRHAILQFNGGAWHVTDANSHSGTFHNQQRLASGQWAQLREGDVLRAGEVDLLYTGRAVPMHGGRSSTTPPPPVAAHVPVASGPPPIVRARLSLHGAPYPPVELGPRTIVGSQPGACQFLLQDPRVGPQHAEIVKAPDGFYVRDLGAPQGTVVSGRPLLPTAAPYKLSHGDVILVGGVPLLFEGATA